VTDEQALDALLNGEFTVDGINAVAVRRVMSTVEDTFVVASHQDKTVTLRSSHHVNGNTATLLRNLEQTLALSPKIWVSDYYLLIGFSSVQQLVNFCKSFDVTLL
jgi:hypothetical protein